MKKLLLLSVSGLAVLLTAGCSDIPFIGGQAPSPTAGVADQEFASKAAESNYATVQMAHLAQQNASSPAVRQFASKLASNSQTANRKLITVAQKDDIGLPTTPSNDQNSNIKELTNLSGAEFDRAFIADQVGNHNEALRMYKDEAANGHNPDLKRYAQSMVSTLEQQLRQAQSLQRQVGTASAADNINQG